MPPSPHQPALSSIRRIAVALPHRLLAFAALYFVTLAVFKFVSAERAASPASEPAPSMATQRRDARKAGEQAMAARKQQLAEMRKQRGDDL